MTKTNLDDSLGQQFPAADADSALNPGNQKQLEVDPISSELESSILEKEQPGASHKKKRQKDAMQSAKTAVLISGIIVAVAGVLFTVVKKLKERND